MTDATCERRQSTDLFDDFVDDLGLALFVLIIAPITAAVRGNRSIVIGLQT
jgi:hypothetical protein